MRDEGRFDGEPISPMNRMMRRAGILLLVAVLCTMGGCAEPGPPALSWPEVEATHKPWTRWWWMGNAVEEETLSQLLAAYDEAGIGGVEITPIYGVRGYEDQFVDYLSPQWMTLLDHTVDAAQARGMGVDMANGTGWPFGGPHIALEDAARRLIVRTYPLAAGARLSEPVSVADENVDATAPLQAVMAYAEGGAIRDLTARVDAQGRLDWTAPAGAWTVYAVFGGWTGKRVERAAPGGEGYVLDHFTEPALQEHLGRFDRTFAAHGRPAVRAYFNDSYEIAGANWTLDFFDAFERQQGYDLRRHLPALTGAAADEKAARIQADYRETLDALLLEEFTRPWVQWTHAQDGIARNQAHGSPANLLDLYAAVDIPETETFHPSGFDIPGLRTDSVFIERRVYGAQPDPLLFKFASSAAHLVGHPLVASETATWLGEHFRVSLAQVKPEVDQLFTAGINHIVFHGTPYSPPEAPWPGWLFYASTHFAPTNPFWRDLPGLTSYITRAQSFLQRGQPDNDVLLYFPVYDHWQRADDPAFQLSIHNPEQWFYNLPMHDAAQAMQAQGYTFDYVSDRLVTALREDGGALHAEGGRYATVVLPAVEHMPLATLEHLIALAESGATVVVQEAMPQAVPGWEERDARRKRLHALREAVAFGPASGTGVRTADVGDGRFLLGADLAVLLDAAGVVREPMADRGLRFARRQHAQGHQYFVSNLGSTPVEGWVPLGTDAASAVLFDPLRDRRGVAAIRDTQSGPEVYLQLEPGASRVLRTFTTASVEGPAWTYLEPGTPQVLDGTWTVAFIDGGPELPADYSATQLTSWTAQGGEAERFAGTARYRLTFEAPAAHPDAWTLDLGRVRESAHVYLNGEDLGRAWAHPFTLPVGDALQPGENVLEVEVTNLMANRIADLDRRGVEWKTFYDINFVGIDYQPFDAANWPPMPSGLLGPVALIPERERPPRLAD